MVRSELKLLIALLLGIWVPVGWAAVPETLSYRVYYQGWLSAMRQLPISEARLVTEQSGQDGLEVSTLSLSSAAHGMVDAVYPIRYRLRSLYDRKARRLMAVERFKHTRKLKHDLAWVDAAADRLHYLRADATASSSDMPAVLRPWLSDTGFIEAAETPMAVPAVLLDRLTLVQTLRRQIPAVDEVLTLAVTDGPKLYRYEIKRVGTETVSIAGHRWPAWRLTVEGYEQRPGEPPSKEADHAPITLWISQDAQRLPLRFRAENAVGDFTVEWVPGGIPITVALDTPIAAPADDWSDEGWP